MSTVEYANPSHLIVEVPPDPTTPVATPAVPPKSAILLMTKDHIDRLKKVLPRVAALPCPVVLIDDSTASSSRASVRSLAKQVGVSYHGRKAQGELLTQVDSRLYDGFIVPLGTGGWTLGFCRNYSILLAMAGGYSQVVLMDDDITLPSADLLARTLKLACDFDFVGAHTVGLPDDSVVGHIARGLGVQQYDFVTGQYLGVRTRCQDAYFPNEYNEDLIFLLLGSGPGRIARYGTVRQLRRGSQGFGVDRALSQEIGEVHCEGCIQAAISSRFESLKEPDFWRQVLAFRWECLGDLVARDQEWGNTTFAKVLTRVLSYSRTLNPESFSTFYKRYYASLPRWCDLQEAIARSGRGAGLIGWNESPPRHDFDPPRGANPVSLL